MSDDLDRYLDEPGIAAKAGVIATRLGIGLPRAVSRNDALLQRALVYAAVAEQRMAAQIEHLAYLESLTITDDVTGLLNRRGFMNALEQALARARRFGETGMVLYADLDAFKAVNDRFGHAAGDEMLRQVARVITGVVREVDIAARIGGDEFAIALTRIAPNDGWMRADMLQACLDKARASCAGHGVPICATVGAAPFGGSDSALDVIARADAAMYHAKRLKYGAAAE